MSVLSELMYLKTSTSTRFRNREQGCVLTLNDILKKTLTLQIVILSAKLLSISLKFLTDVSQLLINGHYHL